MACGLLKSFIGKPYFREMIMKKNICHDFRELCKGCFEKHEEDEGRFPAFAGEEKPRPYKKRRIKSVHKNWEH